MDRLNPIYGNPMREHDDNYQWMDGGPHKIGLPLWWINIATIANLKMIYIRIKSGDFPHLCWLLLNYQMVISGFVTHGNLCRATEQKNRAGDGGWPRHRNQIVVGFANGGEVGDRRMFGKTHSSRNRDICGVHTWKVTAITCHFNSKFHQEEWCLAISMSDLSASTVSELSRISWFGNYFLRDLLYE